MEKYSYLILSLAFLVVWLGIFIYRPDLRKKMLQTSFFGGIAGLLSEFWYFADYWRPPIILGTAVTSPEDFIFGFAIVGVGVTIYDLVRKTSMIKTASQQKRSLAVLFLLGLVSLIVFNNLLGINSIFVSSVGFVAAAAYIVYRRNDLLRVAVISSLLLTAIAILIYIPTFEFVAPNFIDKYWLLADTKWGITLMDSLPLTELLWYLSIGGLLGVSYEFALGLGKADCSELGVGC